MSDEWIQEMLDATKEYLGRSTPWAPNGSASASEDYDAWEKWLGRMMTDAGLAHRWLAYDEKTRCELWSMMREIAKAEAIL